MKSRLVVIGGGAAGFFCAVNAARLNPLLEVVIIEKSSKLLAKVAVSGGGRCNVTHACFSITDMISRYPRGTHFLRKAFHHFFTSDTLQWFEERGVRLKTEADGRMFPMTDSSRTIVDCLMKEAELHRVAIQLRREVKELEMARSRLQICFADEEQMEADFVCVACGGYPQPFQYGWVEKTGHSIEEPVPSLFTFNMPGNPLTRLSGISVQQTQVKIVGTKLQEKGPLLLTHWGMSGPAILRLSAWGARELKTRQYEFSIQVNWLPDYNEQELQVAFRRHRFERAAQHISNHNPFGLPSRLWEYLLEKSLIRPDLRWADLRVDSQNKLIRNLYAEEHTVKGKTTFKEEFVTAGGVRLAEIEPGSMQSKINPCLFFAGEIMDVDGITGGYNFQHAWTSGFIAAKTIAGQ